MKSKSGTGLPMSSDEILGFAGPSYLPITAQMHHGFGSGLADVDGLSFGYASILRTNRGFT